MNRNYLLRPDTEEFELHFIIMFVFLCSAYTSIWEKFMPIKFSSWPSGFKLAMPFSAKAKILSNLPDWILRHFKFIWMFLEWEYCLMDCNI